MNPYSAAIETVLAILCDQAIQALEGIPEDDLGSWRSGQAHGEINTMYGLATHIAGSGEFWILQAAGGREMNRQRLAEFTASGSVADLRARYDRWLADVHEILTNLSDEDLSSVYRRDPDPTQGLSRVEKPVAECIVHALEHAALHVSHLQIQRQLWEQERGGR